MPCHAMPCHVRLAMPCHVYHVRLADITVVFVLLLKARYARALFDNRQEAGVGTIVDCVRRRFPPHFC